jgi:hypothetical protein
MEAHNYLVAAAAWPAAVQREDNLRPSFPRDRVVVAAVGVEEVLCKLPVAVPAADETSVVVVGGNGTVKGVEGVLVGAPYHHSAAAAGVQASPHFGTCGGEGVPLVDRGMILLFKIKQIKKYSSQIL